MMRDEMRANKTRGATVSQQAFRDADWIIGLFEAPECAVSRHQAEFVGFGVISFSTSSIRPITTN